MLKLLHGFFPRARLLHTLMYRIFQSASILIPPAAVVPSGPRPAPVVAPRSGYSSELLAQASVMAMVRMRSSCLCLTGSFFVWGVGCGGSRVGLDPMGPTIASLWSLMGSSCVPMRLMRPHVRGGPVVYTTNAFRMLGATGPGRHPAVGKGMLLRAWSRVCVCVCVSIM